MNLLDFDLITVFKFIFTSGFVAALVKFLIDHGKLIERDRRSFGEKNALRSAINTAEAEKERLEIDIRNLKKEHENINTDLFTDADRKRLWEASDHDVTISALEPRAKKPTKD